MTTLQKTITLSIAAALIALALGSDAEAGRRGRSRRSSFRSHSSSMSRGNFSQTSSRFGSSSRTRTSGKQTIRMNSSQKPTRFGTMNRGGKIETRKPNTRQLNTTRQQTFKPRTFNSRTQTNGLSRLNRGSSRSLILSGKHKGKHKWHFGIYKPYRHYHNNYYVPCTTGFGFQYQCQQVSYSNPYCSPVMVGGAAPVYDDSVQLAGQENIVTETESGKDNFEKAREAFFKGDLKTASSLIDQVAKEMPGNPNVQQFRSLVLFAMKDYDKAAAAAYTALTIGPGWDWKTLNSLFPSTEIYTSLLRALEADMKKDETKTSRKFLLAYHYLMLGEKEAAGKQLVPVIKAEPRNDVAKQLLKMVGVPKQTEEQPTIPPAPVE